jgi:hypothetical protein
MLHPSHNTVDKLKRGKDTRTAKGYHNIAMLERNDDGSK